jgi:molybdopterin-guanine dinucleotide biosynthesis protein
MIVVSLIGLKKCGKTTTAEALIREFKRRELRVGGVKSMPHSSFTIDVKGKDTWRHREAGADFVVSLSKDELVFMERWGKERGEEGVNHENTGSEDGAGRPGLEDVLRLVPGDTDVLVCEGLTQDDPRILRIVLARSPDLLVETFEVRGIGRGGPPSGGDRNAGQQRRSIEDGTRVQGDAARLIAFSGIMANDIDMVPDHPDIPVFNCAEPAGASALADHILSIQ